jgi:hypothetical protein
MRASVQARFFAAKKDLKRGKRDGPTFRRLQNGRLNDFA